MGCIDLLSDPGIATTANAELTRLNPRRDRGNGDSPPSVDVRLRFELEHEDQETVCRVFPWAAWLWQPGAEWGGFAVSRLKAQVDMRVVSLQGDDVISGQAVLRGLRLISSGTGRELEVTLRVAVDEAYEAPARALCQVVTVTAIGLEARKDQGDDEEQQLIPFGLEGAVCEHSVQPAKGDLVEISGSINTWWGKVEDVDGPLTTDKIAVSPLSDARGRIKVHLGRVKRAVPVDVTPKTLASYKRRARSEGGEPSWTWLALAHIEASPTSSVPWTFDADTVQGAVELELRAKLEDVQAAADPLPPEADDEGAEVFELVAGH